MAYQHNQHQILFASGMTATASGDKATWMPGYMPHYVRACGVIVTTSGSTTSGAVFSFIQKSLASGATASDVAVLTMTSGGASGFALPTAALIAGNVMYKDGLNVLVRPGQRVAFNVRTAVTGVCGVRAFMWVEPSWEVPGNTTGVFTTT